MVRGPQVDILSSSTAGMPGFIARSVNKGVSGPHLPAVRRESEQDRELLWIKAFHIIFVIAWFAGLLYLPRLFVYHSASEDRMGRERFALMERRLFAIMSIGGAGALLFGLWLLLGHTWAVHHDALWLHLKLALVALLIAFHVYCAKLMRDLRAGSSAHRPGFFRMVNEVPALLMVAVVLLAVVKRPL